MRDWKDARSVADLGLLMADWLEGRIPRRPGYYGSRPDQETTTGMIRTLAAVNRARFLTDNSQPGYQGRGHDGRKWTQLPFVSGFVSCPNQQLIQALQREGRRAGLVVIVNGNRDDGRPGGVPVTFADSEVITHAGSATPHHHLVDAWSDLGSTRALADLVTAYEITLIDLNGKRRTRLWTVLGEIARRYT